MNRDTMTNNDLILFDLDGTLTDPKEGIVNSIKYALSKYGMEEGDDKYLENFIGPSLFEAFKRFYSFSEDEVINVVNYYREYYSTRGMYENRVYPGIQGLLESLKNKDKKLFVATSKPTVFANKIIKYFKLDKYFYDIFGSNLDGTRVEKNEIIKDILESIDNNSEDNSGKNNAIMIGDRKYDVIGARKNEIVSVGVLYGYGSREEFEYFPPDYLVDGVEDLGKLLL